jgi:hypothetical protein
MRTADVHRYLSGYETWAECSNEAAAEFCFAMKDKSYGREPCRTAWGWFYEGWCRSQEHQSVTLEPLLRGPGEHVWTCPKHGAQSSPRCQACIDATTG